MHYLLSLQQRLLHIGNRFKTSSRVGELGRITIRPSSAATHQANITPVTAAEAILDHLLPSLMNMCNPFFLGLV